MSKIKLTKGELKRQRDSLKQFRHYLPTLQLKKQQLQIKILEAGKAMQERMGVFRLRKDEIMDWVGLLADLRMDLGPWITPEKILTDTINIAGANIPLFRDIVFNSPDYDYYGTPLWVDKAIEQMRLITTVMVEIEILMRQIAILKKELRITTQRVNLFEKIKIPECLENIRKIRINLGDQQANAVGIGKVAKKLLEVGNLEEVLV